MIIRLIITIIFSLILVSCYVAPQSIYILEPVENTGFWLMGKQYFHSKTDDFKVALAFDKMDYNEYEFQVEITNMGDKSILVSPEDFYMVAHLLNNESVFYDTIRAFDPEQEILAAYKKQSQEYARYQSESNTQSLFFFLDLVGDIADIGEPKTEAEILEEENEDLEREIDGLETELDHERNVKSLNNHLSKWESKALRKTTLPKEYLIRGKIYFPLIKKAKALDVHLSLLDKDVVFKYNQVVEKVR